MRRADVEHGASANNRCGGRSHVDAKPPNQAMPVNVVEQAVFECVVRPFHRHRRPVTIDHAAGAHNVIAAIDQRQWRRVKAMCPDWEIKMAVVDYAVMSTETQTRCKIF